MSSRSIVCFIANNLEKMLSKYSKDGWEPIDINHVLTQNKGLIAHVVFKNKTIAINI